MRLIPAVLLSFASFVAVAQTTPSAKAERLARATGLEELLIAAQEKSTASASASVEGMLAQLKRSGIPEEVITSIAPRVQEMMVKVTKSWNPVVASQLYAENLSASLSERELEDAEAYYRSVEGKKTLVALKDSQTKVQSYIETQTNKVLQAELGAFMQAMKEAVAEYRKQQPR